MVRGGSDDSTGSAVTTTTEPSSGPVAPLTRLRLADGAKADRPALAVKIDNLDTSGETALPQSGLAAADIVIEEIVEGDFTDGKVIHGSWDRPDEDQPAKLTDDAGTEISLTPGQTWIELPRDGGVTLR